MKTITLFPKTGSFAEDKDLARSIRIADITPSIEKGNEVVIDFKGVESTTQSFIHALISELFRDYGSDVIERIYFKNCTDSVKGIVNIVVDYMQV